MDSGKEKEFSKELRELGIGAISRPCWSPDGKSIAIYSPKGGSGCTMLASRP
jgi:Tol biopolymer transport system component